MVIYKLNGTFLILVKLYSAQTVAEKDIKNQKRDYKYFGL